MKCQFNQTLFFLKQMFARYYIKIGENIESICAAGQAMRLVELRTFDISVDRRILSHFPTFSIGVHLLISGTKFLLDRPFPENLKPRSFTRLSSLIDR